MPILSFTNKNVETFYVKGTVAKGIGWANCSSIALRKLTMLNGAEALGDLASPPNNRLEALRGNLAGFHSIRVNNQWRVIFRWTDSGPAEVDIVDYH